MAHEDRAFQAYRARPGPDTLRALLTAHQATVYNLAFQVLRSAHDAEDAAQEALLEIVKGVAAVREPRAFKRWLCRVALHTALDHLRRRSRRARHEESRAAMKPVPTDPAAEAIHEALSQLDDDDRCLLAEKYFERATLEEIAAREGISAAAVGKRVERAKDKLKQRLSQAGLAAIVLSVDPMLEAATPAASTPDLVGTSQALDSALALAGGAVMGTKFALSTTTILVALISLFIGAGSGYLIASKRQTAPAPIDTSKRRSSGSAPPSSSSPAARPARNSEVAPTVPPAPGTVDANALLARLDRFKAWHESFAAKRPVKTPQDYERRFILLKEELDGVRDLILADPTDFFEWIGRPENEAYLEDLFRATLAIQASAWSSQYQEFSTLPSSLMEGLLKVLQSGSLQQRRAILAFARFVKNPSPDFRAHYVALLSESYDPEVGPRAVNALLFAAEPNSTELDAVVRYAMQIKEDAVRWTVFQSLGRVPDPGTREWLLDALESGRFPDPGGRLAYRALEWWTYPSNSPGREFEERAARILGAAMQRTTEQDPYFMSLYTALNLPTEVSLRLVEQAATGAPNDALKNGAQAVLERARKPGASPRVLQETWMGEFRQK